MTQIDHLRNAALFWTIGGIVLIARGIGFVFETYSSHAVAVLLVAALVGVAKGLFVLGRASRKSIKRIRQLPEKSPAWQVFPGSTYALIGWMMGLGATLRWAGRHWNLLGIVGIIYVTIGIALIGGSTFFWRAWHRG